MNVMIFAAGLGTRLKPFTDNAPKALFPIFGKPLLFWVTEKIIRTLGPSEIVINIHHFPDMMRKYIFSDEYLDLLGNCTVSVSAESDFLRDTGGGIMYAREMLEGGSFMMHNVDIISDADLPCLVGAHDPGSLATLLVSPRRSSRYLLFDEDMRLKGWYSTSTGEVRSPYPGLRPEDCRMLAFSGIHVASDSIFSCAEKLGFKDKFSITDLYIAACREYEIRGCLSPELRIADAGKYENIDNAGKILSSDCKNCIFVQHT